LQGKYLPVKVLSYSNLTQSSSNRYTSQVQSVTAVPYCKPGVILKLNNFLWPKDRALYNINLKKNNSYIAKVQNGGGYIAFYNREGPLFVIIILFLFFLIVILKLKIISYFVPLVSSALILWFWVFHAFAINQNIELVFFIFVLFSAIITYLFVSGFSQKSFVAIVSVTVSSIAVYYLALYILKMLNISGLSGGFATFLIEQHFYSQASAIEFVHKIVAIGITISALGAGMDMAMSLASTLYEKQLSIYNHISKGFRLIESILPTMLLTLFFIYLLNFLFFFIIVRQLDSPILKIFHFDFFLISILYLIIGLFSLMLNSVFTLFFSGIIYTTKKIGKGIIAFFIVLVVFGSVTFSLAWVEPPDSNFRLLPLTRFFIHKKTDFFEKGQIVKVANKENKILYKIKLLTGAYKNTIVDIDYVNKRNFQDFKKYNLHQNVLVWYRLKKNHLAEVLIDSDYKVDKLLILTILFLFFLLLLLRKAGVKLIILLIIIASLFYFVMIPLFFKGVNVFAVFLPFVFLVMVGADIFFVKKNNFKKFTTLLMVQFFSFLILFFVAILLSKILHLSGNSLLNFQLMHFYNSSLVSGRIYEKEVFLLYLVAGTIGGIIDLSISLVSGEEALQLDKENMKIIGSDMLGTMVNTFFLGFIGSSLGFLFSLYLAKPELHHWANMEILVIEIVKTIIGIAGLVFVLLSFFYFLKSKKNST